MSDIPGDDVPDYEEGNEDRQEWFNDPAHVNVEDVPEDVE